MRRSFPDPGAFPPLLFFFSSRLRPLQQNKKFLPGCPLPSALAGVARTTFDHTCGIKGASTIASKIAESRAKNNFCVATPAVDITYDISKELQQAEICESTDASTCQPNATNGWISLEEFLATD
jgi:hypothetical protein